jgi:RNA polymerase sigma-70 factor (ECF subfamily)
VTELERRARFEALFAEHATAVRAYARRRTDRVSADDVVSDVFVIVWRRLDDVPHDAVPWLLACARRVLAKQRRSADRRIALIARLDRKLEHDAVTSDTGDAVLGRALGTLSERDREVLLLIAWEGLDRARTAAALGCSPEAVSTRLHRARSRLAAALERVASEDRHGLEVTR